MLAAHETGAACTVGVPECERQQQQWPALRVVGDHYEGNQALARADLLLPGPLEIETLERRGELLGMFQTAPDGFGRGDVMNDIDAGDAARFRPRTRTRRP